MKYINPVTDREAWLEARRQGGVGASDSATLMGWGKYKSLKALYEDKIGIGSPFVSTRYVEWGNALEPTVLLKYAQDHGVAVLGRDWWGRPTVFYPDEDRPMELVPNPDRVADLLNPIPGDGPYYANIDAFEIDDQRRPIAFVEVKTTSYRNRNQWDFEPPLHYYSQLLHQRQVLLDRGIDIPGKITVLVGGNDHGTLTFEDSERLRSLLVQRVEDFWDCVKNEWQPSPSKFPKVDISTEHMEDEMSLIVPPPSGGNRNVPVHPDGVFPAVLADIRDMGMRESTWNGETKMKHKVLFVFLTDEVFGSEVEDPVTGEMVEVPEFLVGRPRAVSQMFTMSLHENAALRKFIKQWFGRDLPDEEIKKGFDLESLIGRQCQLNIGIDERNGRHYANINAVMKLGRGQAGPEIPEDYVRFKDREEQETDTPEPATAGMGKDDPLPF